MDRRRFQIRYYRVLYSTRIAFLAPFLPSPSHRLLSELDESEVPLKRPNALLVAQLPRSSAHEGRHREKPTISRRSSWNRPKSHSRVPNVPSTRLSGSSSVHASRNALQYHAFPKSSTSYRVFALFKHFSCIERSKLDLLAKSKKNAYWCSERN